MAPDQSALLELLELLEMRSADAGDLMRLLATVRQELVDAEPAATSPRLDDR